MFKLIVAFADETFPYFNLPFQFGEAQQTRLSVNAGSCIVFFLGWKLTENLFPTSLARASITRLLYYFYRCKYFNVLILLLREELSRNVLQS